jgi:hypothetical protein
MVADAPVIGITIPMGTSFGAWAKARPATINIVTKKKKPIFFMNDSPFY